MNRVYKVIFHTRHVTWNKKCLFLTSGTSPDLSRKSLPKKVRFPWALGNIIKSVRNFLISVSTVTIMIKLFSFAGWQFAREMFRKVCWNFISNVFAKKVNSSRIKCTFFLIYMLQLKKILFTCFKSTNILE